MKDYYQRLILVPSASTAWAEQGSSDTQLTKEEEKVSWEISNNSENSFFYVLEICKKLYYNPTSNSGHESQQRRRGKRKGRQQAIERLLSPGIWFFILMMSIVYLKEDHNNGSKHLDL